MNYELLIGKTIEEANDFLKVRGYFVTDEAEQLHYTNAIKVKIKGGKIVEIVHESKNKKTRRNGTGA